MKRCFFSIIIAILVSASSVFSIFACSEGIEEGNAVFSSAPSEIAFYKPPIQTWSQAGSIDHEAAFAGYAKRFFHLPTLLSGRSISTDHLDGLSKSVSLILQSMIEEVAAGIRTSTRFRVYLEDLGIQTTYSAADLGVSDIRSQEAFDALDQILAIDLDAIIHFLLGNAPYELYWYDKTAETKYEIGGYSIFQIAGSEEYFLEVTDGFTFYFPVAESYADGTYAVDTTQITAARTAAANADAIVLSYSSASDLDKLIGYKNEICALTEYNFDAASNVATAYGDPWQLIWVFDGDKSTNVVCEGYAKAFQYLCDQTSFANRYINCISVTGMMTSGTGTRKHMWNIVSMDDGYNYLVDLTNSDDGSAGSDGSLFMKGYASGNLMDGYTFTTSIGEISYVYDSSVKELFGDAELTLHEENYDPSSPTVTPPTEPTPEPPDAPTVIASGVWGTCNWEIDSDGVLIIHAGTGKNCSIGTSPWSEYAHLITSIEATEEIILPEVSHSLFSIYWIENGQFHSRCISMDLSGLVTTQVTDMSYMFYFNKVLRKLDLSGFDTRNVMSMASMFNGCNRLEFLDISGFDTSNVTTMQSMFEECWELTALDVSGFITSNVTSMHSMFQSCFQLMSLDISGFVTDSVTDMSGMFHSCSNVAALDVSGFDTSNVTSMFAMFANCRSLQEIDVSGFDTSHVTNFGNMFQECLGVSYLDVSGFDTSSATNFECMFFACSSLSELDVSGFNTGKAINMGGMFEYCCGLESLDVSGFDTSNVVNMNYMFCNLLKLKELDVSGFNTGNVREMINMFFGCGTLQYLDVSGFNTQNVENMINMFGRCENLLDIDVSGFDTHNVTDLGFLFGGCSSLKEVDISNFNIGKNTSTLQMFQNCTALERVILPVSIGNIGSNAFENCHALSSIYIPSSVTDIGEQCFNGCYQLCITLSCQNTYAKQVLTAYGYSDQLKISHDEVFAADGIPPTCIEPGLTTGSHCGTCGKVLIAQEIIPALGHKTEVLPACDPTCTETGSTEGSHCSTCGEIFAVQEVLPALGHKLTILKTFFELKEGDVLTLANFAEGCVHLDEFILTGEVSNPDKLAVVDNKISALDTGLVAMPLSVRLTDGFGTEIEVTALIYAQETTILPAALLKIGENAFTNTAAEAFVLQENITSIGSRAFANSNVKMITIPASVTEIASDAFEGCGEIVVFAIDGSAAEAFAEANSYPCLN